MSDDLLSPATQAVYHFICAGRHLWRATLATLSIPVHLGWVLYVVLALVSVLLLSGCYSPSGARWYAPTTWGLFSGAGKITAAKTAEAKLETAKEQQQDAQDDAVRAAQIEIRKAQVAADKIPDGSPATILTRRTLANGMGLLNQRSPLSALEERDAVEMVRELLSTDAGRVAAAELKQQAAEQSLGELSTRLTETAAKVGALEQKLTVANAAERKTHEENLALANELRAQRWRFWLAVTGLVIVGAFAVYAKFALGGVGAALHAAGAPAKVISAMDGQLSQLGQWLIRSGRVAAAKTEAKLSTLADTSSAAGATPGGS